MSLIARIALLVLAVPLVLASGSDCGSGQFRWATKDCCLPSGGPSKPPSPPANTDCPFNWSWNTDKGCCAPHQPPNTLPPPQCPNSWNWNSGSLCCNPPPSTPTTVKAPKPSKTPTDKTSGEPDCDDDQGGNGNSSGNNNGNGNSYGNGNGNGGGSGNGGGNGKGGNGNHKRVDAKKRENRSRNVAPCPKGLSACPVSSLIGGDYECVDTLVDLDNCGGCATLGEGQNCNALPGVWNVGCEQSACKIYTCAEGYIMSRDGKSCNLL